MDGGILAMGHLSWLVISQVHLSIRGGKELSPMPNKGARLAIDQQMAIKDCQTQFHMFNFN